jgi:hypothetical protein
VDAISGEWDEMNRNADRRTAVEMEMNSVYLKTN